MILVGILNKTECITNLSPSGGAAHFWVINIPYNLTLKMFLGKKTLTYNQDTSNQDF